MPQRAPCKLQVAAKSSVQVGSVLEKRSKLSAVSQVSSCKLLGGGGEVRCDAALTAAESESVPCESLLWHCLKLCV